MPRTSDSRWRPIGTALTQFPAPSLPDGADEARGRVRTISEANGGKTKTLFHYGRHRWLGLVGCDRRLRGGALRVAVLIWRHINEKYGYAWPSIPYMVTQLGLHRATVIRSIADLEKYGWLTVERRVGKHGVNHYRIAFGHANVSGQ